MLAKALTSILFWYGISIYCCYLCNAKPAQPSSKGGSILDVFDVVNGQLRDIQIIVGKYLTEYRKSFPNDQDDEFDVTCCQKITIMSHDPLSSPCMRLKKLVKNLYEFSRPKGKFDQFITQVKKKNNPQLQLKIQYLLDKTKILYENFVYLFGFDRQSNKDKIFGNLKANPTEQVSTPSSYHPSEDTAVGKDKNSFLSEWYFNLIDYDSNLNAIFITLSLLRESVITEGQLNCRR